MGESEGDIIHVLCREQLTHATYEPGGQVCYATRTADSLIAAIAAAQSSHGIRRTINLTHCWIKKLEITYQLFSSVLYFTVFSWLNIVKVTFILIFVYMMNVFRFYGYFMLFLSLVFIYLLRYINFDCILLSTFLELLVCFILLTKL